MSPRTVYQIDFTAVASGKRIASTKRRVRWRFGFANPEALAAGEKGTACRGEEHDVTLVWSISSGKRLILADGQEVHYSNSRSNIFDFSWTMRGSHVLKVIAHASPPLTPTPGWRQYDFFVDGQSFFTFPKVYRLGLSPNDPRGGTPHTPTHLAERGERHAGAPVSKIASLEAPGNAAEEEAYLQEAIRQSMEDQKLPPAAASGGGDLLNLFDETPAPVPSAASAASDIFAGPPAPAPFGAAPGAMVPAANAQNPYGSYHPYAQQPAPNAFVPAPPPANHAFAAAPPAATNAFAPAPPAAPNAFVPAPPAATNAFASAPPAAPNAFVPAPPAAPNAFAPAPPAAPNAFVPAPPSSPQPQQDASRASFVAPPTNPTRTFDSRSPQELVTPQGRQTPSTIGFASPPADFSGFATWTSAQGPAASPVPQAASPFSAAAQPHLTMNSLSGRKGLLGDTGGQPKTSMADQAYSKLVNMDTFTLGNPTQPTAKRDNPFDNAAINATVGGTVSLADMKSKKTTGTQKEVMKAPTAGAMVVSGTQAGSWGGQYGGGMQQQQQQQQQPMYGGVQQQQPIYGGRQPQPPMGMGMMGQPPMYGGMQQGGMQQPMYSGMQQPMYGGMQQQQPPMGVMGQQPQSSMGQQPMGQSPFAGF